MHDKPSLQDLLEVQKRFELPSPVLVEKDWYVVTALAAINTADVKPFRLVFSGGTALSRAHRLIRRMSEDIDLKIVSDQPRSRPELRKLRDIVTGALLQAGFQFDPENAAHRESGNAIRYTVYRLPYAPQLTGEGALRPEIKIETAVWPLRLPSVERSVTSFWAEAFKQPPEVPLIPCVALVEKIAEKFVALTRRAGAELVDPSAPRDKTLVRHVYTCTYPERITNRPRLSCWLGRSCAPTLRPTAISFRHTAKIRLLKLCGQSPGSRPMIALPITMRSFSRTWSTENPRISKQR